jgi:GDPmannose 4,6-dehydratase
MPRRALITGITGQDGFYLTELLLREGYHVYGMLRPGGEPDFERIAPLKDHITFLEGVLTDPSSVARLVEQAAPDEIYNLAGNSFVPESWQMPVETADVMAVAVVRLLEAIRAVNPAIRFCQAGSSEMFGQVDCEPQNEQTPCNPRTPYGIAKAAAFWTVANYRRHYGLYACTAIAYNHESPLRNRRFVTRKITDAVARIKLGLQNELVLGNLEAHRDWGFAGDYMRAMWLMQKRETADDFVIATGVTHTVRQLAEIAFGHAGLDWQKYVRVDPALLRPEDPNTLRGDIAKARRELGWAPTVALPQLIRSMVDADLARVQSEASAQTE